MNAVDIQCRICEGIADEKYMPLILKCNDVFKDSAGKLNTSFIVYCMIILYYPLFDFGSNHFRKNDWIFDSATKAAHYVECLKFVALQSQAKMSPKCSLFHDNVLTFITLICQRSAKGWKKWLLQYSAKTSR